MCTVSHKIKFCTCAALDEEQYNYWILHRFNKDKNEVIVGEPLIPFEWLDLNYEVNKKTIENRLNEDDAFDTPLLLKEKDQLEIGIGNQDQVLIYCYKYSKGKWIEEDYDPFRLMGHFDEFEVGKLKHLK